MTALEAKIIALLDENVIEQTITFYQEDYPIISQIHDMAEILEKKYDDDTITIRFRMDKKHADRLKKALARKSSHS